ncbi:unnamed protein product, partial [Trichogramma brassicae]
MRKKKLKKSKFFLVITFRAVKRERPANRGTCNRVSSSAVARSSRDYIIYMCTFTPARNAYIIERRAYNAAPQKLWHNTREVASTHNKYMVIWSTTHRRQSSSCYILHLCILYSCAPASKLTTYTRIHKCAAAQKRHGPAAQCTVGSCKLPQPAWNIIAICTSASCENNWHMITFRLARLGPDFRTQFDARRIPLQWQYIREC